MARSPRRRFVRAFLGCGQAATPPGRFDSRRGAGRLSEQSAQTAAIPIKLSFAEAAVDFSVIRWLLEIQVGGSKCVGRRGASLAPERRIGGNHSDYE
jgi:hypothetical protein